ncbi:predicted protein [Uncinocarpus reesii 1704]|uniref:MOSC domain-containing protein n=1 Tax=Uncinocarpus reesii (strain UAMH 1704) TaxID=336963 RepID=C4JS47_UNCRE|nr:uncharacterized protein UREG_05286 [Uncinocarpus reesii 1704]EEP80444.1 predicted protein [Uncinocarpus reesii 1704]
MSVLGVCLSADHSFSKSAVPAITLLPGLGVKGDAHAGTTDQHLPRKHINPPPPNLRQVHLMQSEILSAASSDAAALKPGDVGENITTTGIDLLSLSKGTKLRFVDESSQNAPDTTAVVTITGLRNPCPRIDKFRAGLKEKFVVRNEERKIVQRKAGIMGVVEVGGEYSTGFTIDPIEALIPVL